MAPCVYYSGVGDIECSQKLTSGHQLSLQDKNAPSIFITRPWIPGRTLCPPPWPKLLPYTDWSCVRNCCCVIIHNVCSRFGVGDISRRPRLVPLRVCLTFVAPRGIPVKERQQLGWPLWVLSQPPPPLHTPFPFTYPALSELDPAHRSANSWHAESAAVLGSPESHRGHCKLPLGIDLQTRIA